MKPSTAAYHRRGRSIGRPGTRSARRCARGTKIRRAITRLPGYVLGRAGLVTRVCGSYVLPDANAHLRGESPEHVYSVRFAASDLWGERGEANTVVYVDTWESYLEPITAGEGRMHGRA